MFAHLHTHTEHSSLDGASRISSICDRAASLGQTALAITDHGSLAGAYKFMKAAKKADIKPIIGMEAYLAIGSRFEQNSVKVERDDDDSMGDADEGSGASKTKTKRYEHLTILAATEEGWRNLLALHNKSHESYWYKPRIDYALLKEHSAGLIVLTGCLAGPIAGPLARGNEAEARENLETLIDCVGQENIYLEIMYHGIGSEKQILRPIKALSDEYGIPLVATNDSHYEKCEDAHVHDAFLAVGTGANLDTKGRFKFNGEGYWLKSEEEMRAVMAGPNWAAACDMTQTIADRIEDCVIPEAKLRLPRYDVPAGFNSSETYLKHLALEGAAARYPAEMLPAVHARLDEELGVINEMGFADYFLITWDFINWCRSDVPADYTNPEAERKIPIVVGLGRGSAAGSALSYCLKIVGVDPIENDLLFERFLEPGRAGMPDIDIDVESNRRDEALRYLQYRWGRENTAQIGSFTMAKTKASIKDAARVLKPSVIPAEVQDHIDALRKAGSWTKASELAASAHEEMEARASALLSLSQKLSELVPASGEKPYTFAQLQNRQDPATEAFWRIADGAGEDATAILDLAVGFEEVAKSPSIHPCGFVVSPEPLDSLVPLRFASNAKTADPNAPRIICWDGVDCDEYGLLKMDVLALMNLTLVSRALANIEISTGEHLDLEAIPHPNTKGNPMVDAAWGLMARGKTGGCFQMESQGMQKISQDVRPETLTDISAVVALFRPGPLAAKVPDAYAARKHGHEAVSYDQFTKDPVEQEWIAKVLGDTYGLFVFQEQLMRLGTVIAGFDASQRSVLRKAVGKKDAAKMVQVGQMLADGAEREFFDEDGILISPKFSRETAARVFELMKGSASYLFNASHSAAYGMLAYITAYLKANWPVEYGAAILNVADKDDKRRHAFASLREDGIVVHAPDVNTSLVDTAAVNGAVWLGFSDVKGVASAAAPVVAEREANGPFTSLRDVMDRVKITNTRTGKVTKITRTTLTALVEAGAFDAFGTRLGHMQVLAPGKGASKEPGTDEWLPVERSKKQRARLGVALGEHPLTSMRGTLVSWPLPEDYSGHGGDRLKGLGAISDRSGSLVLTAGVIADWAEKSSKSGRRANIIVEGSKISMPGVVWSSTLAQLQAKGKVPEVGDVVAIFGVVKVRQLHLGDDDEVGEVVSVKEITVNDLWPIGGESAAPLAAA